MPVVHFLNYLATLRRQTTKLSAKRSPCTSFVRRRRPHLSSPETMSCVSPIYVNFPYHFCRERKKSFLSYLRSLFVPGSKCRFRLIMIGYFRCTRTLLVSPHLQTLWLPQTRSFCEVLPRGYDFHDEHQIRSHEWEKGKQLFA